MPAGSATVDIPAVSPPMVIDAGSASVGVPLHPIAADLAASASTWCGFVDHFNALTDAPAVPEPRPISSHPSAACLTAIHEARADRERARAVADQLKMLAGARVRPDAKRHTTHRSVVQVASDGDVLPRTGKPVSDGLVYPEWLFTSQLELIGRDPFLDVSLPSWTDARVDAFNAVHRRVRAWRGEQPFDTIWYIGLTRGPSQRFHRRDYGYFMKGFDEMLVLYRGPPHWCGWKPS